jgi:hypothetical protein
MGSKELPDLISVVAKKHKRNTYHTCNGCGPMMNLQDGWEIVESVKPKGARTNLDSRKLSEYLSGKHPENEPFPRTEGAL